MDIMSQVYVITLECVNVLSLIRNLLQRYLNCLYGYL